MDDISEREKEGTCYINVNVNLICGYKRSVMLCELLNKLVLLCDIVSVGKKSYCEFDKFEVGAEKGTDDKY